MPALVNELLQRQLAPDRQMYRLLRYVLQTFCQLAIAAISRLRYYLLEKPEAARGIGFRVFPGSLQCGGRWCIFASNQRGNISHNLLTYLECLSNAGYNVILINDGLLADELVNALLPFCHSVVIRPRGGRDFGSYKCGSLFLHNQEKASQARQIIYCNDSIFVRPSNLVELLSELKELNHDYMGICDNYDISYHVQSWFFGISGRLFNSTAFIEFWQRYKPYSYRQHCIHKGEVAISKHILHGGVSPYLFFPQRRIMDVIFHGTPVEVIDRVITFLRPYLYEEVSEIIRTIWLGQTHELNPDLSYLRREMLERVVTTNSVNNLNLILVKFSSFPFLKKDLVYRAQYTVSQIEKAVVDWSEDDTKESGEILAYYKQRGTLGRRYSFSAILARLGAI
jgi:hypothetical protein